MSSVGLLKILMGWVYSVSQRRDLGLNLGYVFVNSFNIFFFNPHMLGISVHYCRPCYDGKSKKRLFILCLVKFSFASGEVWGLGFGFFDDTTKISKL